MVIQHNIMALNAQRQLGINTKGTGKSIEKLSSGYRVNRAADDAAGLAISEKMRAQITGLNRATMNANDGISVIQTAEGALQEVHGMLNRLEDLTTEASNGILDATDRGNLQAEMDAILGEIDRIAENTNFNGRKLLDGELAGLGVITEGSVAARALGGGINIDSNVSVKIPTSFAANGDGTLSAAFLAPTSIVFSMPSKDGGAPLTQTIDIGPQIDRTGGAAYTINLGGFAQISMKNDAGTPSLSNTTVTQRIQTLLDGSGTSVTALTPEELELAGMRLQIGDTEHDYINVMIPDMSTMSLDLAGLSVGTVPGANAAIANIKNAINTVSSTRGDLGAAQNRLEHTVKNLGVMTENMTETESRIRDLDMAKEMMTFTKLNILSQSAQSMLSQANMQPQQVLQLLR